MAPETDREIARALGQVEGAIDGFKTTLDHLSSAWAEQDRQASTGRRELYRKMDQANQEVTRLVERFDSLQGLAATVTSLEQRVSPFIDTVKRIEPIVNKLDRTYTQGSAIGMLIKGLWMAAAGAVGALVIRYWPG